MELVFYAAVEEDGTDGLTIQAYVDPDKVGADVVLLHNCPQSCMPNPIKGLLEVCKYIVEVLLVLEIFLTHLIYSLTAREGRLGTTDDFATSFFFHLSLFSTVLWDLANSRPVHSLMLSSHLFFCQPCLLPPFPRNGELRTQKLMSQLVRTQSLNILPLKPGVGRYIAMRATPTARDFFLLYFYTSGPFTCILSKTSPDFFCVGCG